MPIIDSPDFGHAFVPIDSLTNSPSLSSTGSASVLEWNSNSGSEGFSVHSLDHEQCDRSSPVIPSLSSSTRILKNLIPDHDENFASFTSAAPTADSVANTVTSDTFVDEYRNLLSALEERLTLQDSVTQWQNQSYRETAGLDRPGTPSDVEILERTVHDTQHDSTVPSPNHSVTVATDSSISTVTAKPSLHVSPLFLPPAPPTPHVHPASPSVVSYHSPSESISIAQYLQLKAEEAGPVQPPAYQPLRPMSAASCLSYASSVQSPVAVPLSNSVEAPLFGQTWHDLISKIDISNSTMPYPPSTARPPQSWYHPKTSPYREPTYSSQFGPSAVRPCRGLPPSSTRKLQMENNDAGSQFNPFITAKVTPPSPSSQGADTLESNLKSYAPSRPTWPITPVIPGQFEDLTLKPIKPNSPCLTNTHGCQPPCLTYSHGSLHGKIPKSSSPVPPSSLQPPDSLYPTFHRQAHLPPAFSRPSPWRNEPRTRDIGLASPGSTDSGLPPPPSTPSASLRWPSPTPPGSPMSAPVIPPSPSSVDLHPGYLRHTTTTGESNSNVLCVPPTPSPPPHLNEGYTSTRRIPRALPTPSIPRACYRGLYSQAAYTPRYTGSTLPRDMHPSVVPPTWGPTPRRLRFAPLPPTPSAGPPYAGIPNSTLPYTTPLPPYPSCPMPYPVSAPQIPASVSTPYSSWRPGGINSSQYWAPHPVFWYSDGSIVFRIENVEYKVHRHFFERHSAYFRDLLAYPTYAVTSPLPHNIYLSDVKKVDFERLLSIFYPSNLIGHELFTIEEWTSILTLSDKWRFAQLKTLATRELGLITSSIEKIALAKKYNIGNPQWLLAAYRELCTRHHPLSLIEGEKLGLETVIKIWEIQHELMMNSWGRSVDIMIQDKFGLF